MSNDFLRDAKDGVKTWKKEGSAGIPVYYLYYYLPKSSSLSPTNAEDWARDFVWKFKDGDNTEDVVEQVVKVLKHFFLQSTLSEMTFVCIPASTAKKNEVRYEWFSSQVASACDMWDGYDHITIRYDREAAHLGGDSVFSNLKFDSTWFMGKNVIIFDDIFTTGNSIQRMTSRLKSFGATVIGAITLGRTVHHHHGTDPYDAGNWGVKRVVQTGNSSSGINATTQESVRLYRMYNSVSRVARMRGFAESTIYGHLFTARILNPWDYITQDEYNRAVYTYDCGEYELPSQELDRFLSVAGKAAFYHLRRR